MKKSCFFLLIIVFGLLFIGRTLAQEKDFNADFSCKYLKQEALQKQLINSTISTRASNERSDSIDILNYTINLDITDFTTNIIKGNCAIRFTPKINNINSISLDMLQLNVDSITNDNTLLSYTYNDTLLLVNLPVPLNISETSTVIVYYNGIPQGDPSGWGGFYFQSGYAFNLGVGFGADPHNYGRVWFPCFDNFIERSTYEFNILTANGKKAFCNGELTSEVTVGTDSVIRTWKMQEEIPTYLACVAVANYATVNQNHSGINGNIPIMLAALAADTANIKNSFVNLGNAITAYENSYGPYRWNKVGYSFVPFSSGAMEHASNITYPRIFATGSLVYETLMAHELSHHWWGNLTTCETAEDMWINEGMASYSEHLFTQHIYGQNAYTDAVKTNLEDVLHYAHITENGYRAISGLPHEYTYGDHVYKKGAVVAHSLRGYLGDSLFFTGLKSVLNDNQFTQINSYDLSDELSLATGVDLTDFFNDWVFNPGFPHFSIDSVRSISIAGNYDVTVYVKQKLKGAPAFYTNVPMQITFMDNSWNKVDENIVLSGQYSSFNFTLPFNPVFTTLNENNKINHAVSDVQKVITATGNSNFTLARMSVTVTSISDSALVKIEHNWVGPDNFQNPLPNLMISPYRYWKVDGILPADFKANAKVYYDGRLTTGGGGYLDHTLLGESEDSIILLYRKDRSESWREYDYYTQNTQGSTPNKYGYMTIDTLVLGEYTFAYGDRAFLGNNEITLSENDILIYPNPASSNVAIQFKNPYGKNYDIKVIDITGKEIYRTFITSNNTIIDTGKWNNGFYLLNISENLGSEVFKKLVIVK